MCEEENLFFNWFIPRLQRPLQCDTSTTFCTLCLNVPANWIILFLTKFHFRYNFNPLVVFDPNTAATSEQACIDYLYVPGRLGVTATGTNVARICGPESPLPTTVTCKFIMLYYNTKALIIIYFSMESRSYVFGF